LACAPAPMSSVKLAIQESGMSSLPCRKVLRWLFPELLTRHDMGVSYIAEPHRSTTRHGGRARSAEGRCGRHTSPLLVHFWGLATQHHASLGQGKVITAGTLRHFLCTSGG